VKFKSTMEYSGNEWFDSPDLIQALYLKLPGYMQDRWNRHAYKIRERNGTEARLGDFISYLHS